MIDFLGKIFAVLQAFAAKFTDALNALLTPLIVLFYTAVKVAKWMGETFIKIKDKLDAGFTLYAVLRDYTTSSIYSMLPAGAADAFAFVNYVAPITELIVVGALLVALMIVSAAVRFIKSWIPTIS